MTILMKSALPSRKILDEIKHLLQIAQEAKLLVYTSLCRPLLEYADVVWDPVRKQTIYDIELIQNNVI